MKFLVTGGAGFIGSNLAIHLAARGNRVRIMDNFSSGRRENIADLPPSVEVIEGDIRDYATVTRAVTGVDYVLHQAALSSVPKSVNDPLTTNDVNVSGTLNLLEASRRAGVKKLVYASSASVYGDSEELPKHEGMSPQPASPYAITKLVGEHYCRTFWDLYRFPTASLRYFNVFGPRQDPGSQYAAVIPTFVARLLRGKAPVVFGDGEQSRDFIFIDDCVRATVLAATTTEMVGTHFNVATGSQFTLNDLLDRLRSIIGVEIAARIDPPCPGDIRHSFASIEKLARYGYRPTVDFETGLRRTVEFFRKDPGSGLSPSQIENRQPQ